MVLSDDLLQREALLSGEISQVSPAVLTDAQMTDEEPLPACLAGQEARPGRHAADAVWEAYFHYAAQTADHTHNNFLADWVGYEVALRNALATRRAEMLGLDPGDYIVAACLAEGETDFTETLNAWSAAANPLLATRVLDRARWAWLVEHDRWFSFADDELTAYAAKLMLIQRWRRIADGGGKDASNRAQP